MSDVVFRDETDDVGARNERHVVAVYSGTTTGFELIHGLMDLVRFCRVMASIVIAHMVVAYVDIAMVYIVTI